MEDQDGMDLEANSTNSRVFKPRSKDKDKTNQMGFKFRGGVGEEHRRGGHYNHNEKDNGENSGSNHVNRINKARSQCIKNLNKKRRESIINGRLLMDEKDLVKSSMQQMFVSDNHLDGMEYTPEELNEIEHSLFEELMNFKSNPDNHEYDYYESYDDDNEYGDLMLDENEIQHLMQNSEHMNGNNNLSTYDGNNVHSLLFNESYTRYPCCICNKLHLVENINEGYIRCINCSFKANSNQLGIVLDNNNKFNLTPGDALAVIIQRLYENHKFNSIHCKNGILGFTYHESIGLIANCNNCEYTEVCMI